MQRIGSAQRIQSTQSRVGHFTLSVTCLVSCVGNGLADQWKAGSTGYSHGGPRPLKCKHSGHSGFSATL